MVNHLSGTPCSAWSKALKYPQSCLWFTVPTLTEVWVWRELTSSTSGTCQACPLNQPPVLSFPAPSVTNQSSWPPPINRNWLEVRQEIQARLSWGPAAAEGSENKQQVPLPAPSLSGAELAPYGGWGWGCVQRVADGWLRWCAPLRWRCRQEAGTEFCFCSRLFNSGSWVFWSLCIFCPETAPKYAPTQLILVPDSFFAYCCSRRGVSRCKHCSKGSQHVSHPHTMLMGKDSRPGGLSAHGSPSLSLKPPASWENGKAGGEKSFWCLKETKSHPKCVKNKLSHSV